MPSIILYAGEASPSDIVVREFVGDAAGSTAASTDIILYLESVYAATFTPVVCDLVLYAGEASPGDIVLRSAPYSGNVAVSPNVTVMLRGFGQLDEQEQDDPGDEDVVSTFSKTIFYRRRRKQ